RVVDEADLARMGVQVSFQQLAQRPPRDNEAPSVPLEAKPRAAISLVIRQRRIKPLGSGLQANGPASDVHHSASATTTSRGPSNASLPWAARMLATTSTSPACHGSRTVCASYTSLISWMTSGSIGSPLPK